MGLYTIRRRRFTIKINKQKNKIYYILIVLSIIYVYLGLYLKNHKSFISIDLLDFIWWLLYFTIIILFYVYFSYSETWKNKKVLNSKKKFLITYVILVILATILMLRNMYIIYL